MNDKKQETSRKKKRRKAIKIISVAFTPLLLVSGCVVTSEQENNPEGPPGGTEDLGSAAPSEAERHTEVIASSASTSTTLGSDLKLDIYALESVGNDLLRLRLGLTNNSSDNFFLYSGLSDKDNLHSASDVTLVDAANQKRHLSYTQLDGSCFCSSINGNISPGATEEMWVIFPAPDEETENMTVTTPMTPPLMDVPISESSETVENSGLSDPEIVPLTLISDNLEDQTGRSESGSEVSIILSSDVLFEANSSELSEESEEILEEVSAEIEEARSDVVNIDGYADNTGNDSINIPLSQERAESVESVLSDLINRGGISFNVDGHGSSDPIADNDTEEGRKRNRRVTVTFEK